MLKFYNQAVFLDLQYRVIALALHLSFALLVVAMYCCPTAFQPDKIVLGNQIPGSFIAQSIINTTGVAFNIASTCYKGTKVQLEIWDVSHKIKQGCFLLLAV